MFRGIILACLVFLPTTGRAEGNGSIGLFSDPFGGTCDFTLEQYVPTIFYILAQLEGETADGINGAEFSVVGLPSSGIAVEVDVNPAVTLELGNPFAGESGGGTNITFPECQQGSNGFVLLYTVTLTPIQSGFEDVVLEVQKRNPPSSSNRAFPLLNTCNPPIFTAVEAEGLKAVLNPVEESCTPQEFHVGLFADSLGTDTSIVAPQLSSTRAYLRGGRVPINGGEFRLEVETPAGFQFEYEPPENASVIGSLFDTDPDDSLNVAGITVQFDTCQGNSEELANFGSIQIINISGAFTRVSVKRKHPISDPELPCPVLYQCNPPLYPPACMDLDQTATIMSSPATTPTDLFLSYIDSTEAILVTWSSTRDSLEAGFNVYRSIGSGGLTLLNPTVLPDTFFIDSPPAGGDLCYQVAAVDLAGGESAPTPGECISVFIKEELELDLHSGTAVGTVAPLFLGRHFLVEISGTGSVWQTSAWNLPNVVCGLPEDEPMFASPGAPDYWVGFDAEVLFAQPLSPGTDCTNESLPRHEGHLLTNTGSGDVHVEPLGGLRSSPAYNHTYKYLIVGQDSTVSFRWAIGNPADSYGIFKITVEEVDPTTDSFVTPHTPMKSRVTAVPNPFNPGTEIRYTLDKPGHVQVKIFDVRGRSLWTLLDSDKAAGHHSIEWNGLDQRGDQLPSGIYYAQVTSLEWTESMKLVLLK